MPAPTFPTAMRALWLLLAPSLLLPASLTACLDFEHENDTGGNPPALDRMDVVTRPASAPRPGDTLTFFVVFPDSATTKYAIAWTLDTRGERLSSGCTRAVCAKWVVPMTSRGRYEHYVDVSSSRGLTVYPFETLVLP